MVSRPRGVAKRLRTPARRSRAGTILGVGNALSLLVRLYGDTDKLSHGYLPHYETHLGPRRFDAMVVFEIGVGGYESLTPGGSLAVWRDYLIRSRIVGLDIEEKLVRLGSRVAFERADQSSEPDLRGVIARHGMPDIVIDDGSHVGGDIRASFEFLWPQMRAGSIYVIEDLSTSYYPAYHGSDPPPPSSAVALLQSMVDSVQACDDTFDRYPDWGTRSAPEHAGLHALHVYPGIAFIVKG